MMLQFQTQLQVRAATVEAQFTELKTMLNAKHTGVGATTNADFYGSVRPAVKSFLHSSEKVAANMKRDFTSIVQYEHSQSGRQRPVARKRSSTPMRPTRSNRSGLRT
jgi:hypothetical protein